MPPNSLFQSQVPQRLLNAEMLDRISFQLFLLYQVGVPGEESLSLLAEDMASQQIRSVLSEMAEEVGAGKTLTESATRTGCFPNHFLHMLKIGEISGKLAEVLAALSTYYRREAETQSTLRRAVTYPCMMAGFVFVVFAIMLSQVLPVFGKVFQQMGVSLPPLAQGLLTFGNVSGYVAGILCFLLLIATICFLIRAKQGKGLPIGKQASESLDRAQFARAISMILSAGMSLEAGLDYSEQLLHNTRLTKGLVDCRKKMDEGISFAKALEQAGVFSPLQAGLLTAGMRAGDTERAMDEIAERSMEESDRALTHFVSKLEILLLIALCTSVGLVLLSVMLPLVGILSSIG